MRYFNQTFTSVNDAVMDAVKMGLIDIEPKARELVLFYGLAHDMPFVLASLAKTEGTVAEVIERNK